MTTKEYLLQLRTIDFDIINVQSEADSWRELAMKMGHEYSDIHVDSSPSPDRMENLIVKAVDAATKADKEKEILIYLKATIEKQIKSLEDKECALVLWGYYHDRMTIEYISKKLNFSFRTGWRIRGKAEKMFEEKYGSEYKNLSRNVLG